MKVLLSSILLLLSSYVLSSQVAYESDIQDFDEKTGVGCRSNKPVSGNAEYYFVCISKVSADAAWNAALYRGKMACKGKDLSVLFNINPTTQAPSGFYGAQVELNCAK